MALTTCPECGAEISELAPVCPKCGRPSAESLKDKSYENIFGVLGCLAVVLYFVARYFRWI